MKSLTIDDFRKALSESFVLQAGGGQSLILELVSLTDLTLALGGAQGLSRVPFSALFRGPLTPWAKQCTYRLTSPTMGELDIFLVPLGPDSDGMVYEAVFG